MQRANRQRAWDRGAALRSFTAGHVLVIAQIAPVRHLTYAHTGTMHVRMRTTLVIPDPLFERAKAYAKEHDTSLPDVFAEALAERLARADQLLREPRVAYEVKTRSMGAPSINLSDREALGRAMEES